VSFEESKQNRIICDNLYERAKVFIPHFGWSLFAIANGYSNLEELEADLLWASVLNNKPKLIRKREISHTKVINGNGIHIELDKFHLLGLDCRDSVSVIELGKTLLIAPWESSDLLKTQNSPRLKFGDLENTDLETE
jgi:hypothetical protein